MVLLSVCFALSASAAKSKAKEQTSQDGRFVYIIRQDKKVHIRKYKGDESKVVVPAEIDGIAVYSVGRDLFDKSEKIEKVTLSEGIKQIGDYGFDGLKNLKEIVLPSTMKTIKNFAFQGCSSLKEVIIPESVKEVRAGTFCETSDNLKIVFLNPECVVNTNFPWISENATICGYNNSTAEKRAKKLGLKFESLGYCEKIFNLKVTVQYRTSIELSWQNNKDADKYEVYISKDKQNWTKGAESKTNFVKVKNLDASTWYYIKIRTIIDGEKGDFNTPVMVATKPKTITDVKAKNTTDGLVKVTWKPTKNVDGYRVYFSTDNFKQNIDWCYVDGEKAKSFVFKDENRLDNKTKYYFKVTAYKTKDELPAIKSLTESSYSNTVSLKTKTFSYKDEPNASDDFKYTVNDKGNIKIIKYIGDNERVVLPSKIDGKKVTTIGRNSFRDNLEITSVVLPEGITYIGMNAFCRCEKLEFIDIPDTVKTICEGAFYGCKNLKKIVIPEKVEDVKRYTFSECYEYIKVVFKNPECVFAISDSEYEGISETVVISGYNNSTAEKYAKENGIRFVSLGTGEKVYNIEIKDRGRTYLSLKWQKIDKADKYQIYVSTNGTKWKKAGESKTNKFKLSDRKASTWYYVKVRAIKDGEKCKFSSVCKTATKPKTPQNIEVKLTKKGNVKVSWDKQTKVSGYKIYFSTDKNFKNNVEFDYTFNWKSNNLVLKKQEFKKGKTYYFKVVAYKWYGDKFDFYENDAIESSPGKTVSIKVK